jgi:TPR repeat protein
MAEGAGDQISLAESLIAKGGAKNTERAEKILRELFISEDGQATIPAILLLREIRERLRDAHPEITEGEYAEARGSIGIALLEKYGYEKAINALIEEAACLSAIAQNELELIYMCKVDGCPAYDGRILEFFEETAAEGLPRSLFFLGQVYKNGWGVQKDEEKGEDYLYRSDWQNRGFELFDGDRSPATYPENDSETVTV